MRLVYESVYSSLKQCRCSLLSMHWSEGFSCVFMARVSLVCDGCILSTLKPTVGLNVGSSC